MRHVPTRLFRYTISAREKNKEIGRFDELDELTVAKRSAGAGDKRSRPIKVRLNAQTTLKFYHLLSSNSIIMVLARLFSQLPRQGMIATRRMSSSTTPSTRTPEIPAPTEHRVVLDNQTLYISQELAEGLGWKPSQSLDGVKLSLHGWDPTFFTITPTGTDFGIQISHILAL